jgi:hypothetical protein
LLFVSVAHTMADFFPSDETVSAPLGNPWELALPFA